MPPNVPSSFIPKRPVLQGVATSQAGLGVFFLLSVLIFLIGLLSSAGVFLYKSYLQRSIAGMDESLTRAKAAFEPALIQELKSLDNKIESSKPLLKGHTALSSIFNLLEEATLSGVRFDEFSYASAGGKKLSLSIHGQARNYAAVALQSDTFGKTKYLSNQIFSDLDLDGSGRVIFSFVADVSPELISYGNILSGEVAPSALPSGSEKGTESGEIPASGQ